MEKKKQRIQCNWKFRENESPEFYEWFDNQGSLSNSLRSMLYHMIELYGTADVLNPSVQKEIVRTSLVMGSLQGKDVIQVDTQMVNTSNVAAEPPKTTSQEITETQTETPTEMQTKTQTETSTETRTETVVGRGDNHTEDDDLYGEVEIKNLK